MLNSRNRIWTAALLLFIAIPAHAIEEDALKVAKAESVGMSSERVQRIETYIQEYIDANQIAGAVTLVARKGKVVRYDAQGWRYKEENARDGVTRKRTHP